MTLMEAIMSRTVMTQKKTSTPMARSFLSTATWEVQFFHMPFFLWSSHRTAWIDATIDPIVSTHLFLPRLCWRTRWWLRWSRRLLVWRTRRWGSIPTPWGFKWMWRGGKLAKISNKHERENSNTLPLMPMSDRANHGWVAKEKQENPKKQVGSNFNAGQR